MAIKRIFIANRGEIAVRIIATCQKLGIETVLGVSDGDRGSLGARLATRAVCIGPAASTASYLKIDTVIEAAQRTGCDAVHPGYGFLSENSVFAEKCEAEGLIFIGPTPAQILAVGDKLRARGHAEAAGVPIVPGGSIATLAEARALAETIGFPLLIKAVAGGGGRGMKRVDRMADLASQVDLAISEATSAFGDGRLYLEHFIARGRHIEVQVIGDGETVIHLGERDCSVQRRYQKVIEEAPAPGLDDATRTAIHEAALRFCRHLGYRSLGTVEFLVDAETNAFFFLEMNARIQVEHPVTEAITGLDLVAEQIAIAETGRLRLTQGDVRFAGHAIEARVNAEDIARDFRPSPGRLSEAWFPSEYDIRVDTFAEQGALIPPYYDSMIAKVIARGATRTQAIARLDAALGCARVTGVATNIALHRAVLADAEFAAGGIDTHYLTRFMAQFPTQEASDVAA